MQIFDSDATSKLGFVKENIEIFSLGFYYTYRSKNVPESSMMKFFFRFIEGDTSMIYASWCEARKLDGKSVKSAMQFLTSLKESMEKAINS